MFGVVMDMRVVRVAKDGELLRLLLVGGLFGVVWGARFVKGRRGYQWIRRHAVLDMERRVVRVVTGGMLFGVVWGARFVKGMRVVSMDQEAWRVGYGGPGLEDE